MAIHAPVVHPRPMPSVAGLGSFLLAIVLLGMLATLIYVVVPKTTTPSTTTPVWMTEQRHGEIDEALSGAPHGNFRIFREGEFNASYAGSGTSRAIPVGYPSGYTAAYSPAHPVSAIIGYPSGYTATYSPTGTFSIVGYPSGFTATYSPLNQFHIHAIVP